MKVGKRIRQTAAVVLPIAFIGVFVMRDFFFSLAAKMPKCIFHILTGGYCTGCGNTRSVLHLLRGEIFLSLRCNPAPIMLIVIAMLLYAELVCGLFGKKFSFLPRKTWFWLMIIGLYLVWAVLRNFVDCLAPL